MIRNGEKKQEDIPRQWDREAVETGQRLRRARKSLHMTPRQLAALMGTSRNIITRIEQGKQLLPTPWLPQLAEILGTNCHWLATGVTPVSAEEFRAGEEKCRVYDEVAMLMKVSEVAEMINYQLKMSKLIFKDRINDAKKEGKINALKQKKRHSGQARMSLIINP